MPSTNPQLETLHCQVGFVVVQWGHCEQSLELLTNVLFQYFGGKPLTRTKKMPKQLGAKLDFVKTCAVTLPALASFKDDLIALVDDFDQLTQIRHNIVHGALAHTSPVGSMFQFNRLQTHPDTHEVMPFLYDLEVFPQLKKQLLRLGVAAPRMAKRVFEARPST